MTKEGILESLLYVQGDEGLSLNQITEILEVTEEEAKEIVNNLKKDYENDNRGLRINYLGNTLKLATKEECKDYFLKLIENPSSNLLTQASLETLAIIAYNEPITRIKVDELRGVDSAYIVRRLLAKGFIKEVGKADLPGRPTLYKTTDEFLDYFGLSSIEELPPLNLDEVAEIEEKDLFKSNYKEEVINDENH